MALTYESIANFTIGSHISRIKQRPDGERSDDKTWHFYATEQFQADDWQCTSQVGDKEQIVRTDQPVLFTQAGDVVISLIQGKAVMVSTTNAGRILGNNYLKVDVDPSLVDAAWFIWHFNESSEIQRQRLKATQGSTVVRRLAVNELRHFRVTLPLLARQQTMGKLYLTVREKRYYQQRLAALYEHQILSQLSEMI